MNEYTRTITITIKEIVPHRELLPYCDAWLVGGDNCRNRARYELDGHPVCGVHLGKPNTIWRNWK